MSNEQSELGALRVAFDVLQRIVRDEFPSEHTLAEIVHIWGHGTPAEVEAVRRLERQAELFFLSCHLTQSNEIYYYVEPTAARLRPSA